VAPLGREGGWLSWESACLTSRRSLVQSRHRHSHLWRDAATRIPPQVRCVTEAVEAHLVLSWVPPLESAAQLAHLPFNGEGRATEVNATYRYRARPRAQATA
jgi:hypothetical protein